MKIVSENQFSGKTYFYTIASRAIRNLMRPDDYVIVVEHDLAVRGVMFNQLIGQPVNRFIGQLVFRLTEYPVIYINGFPNNR